MRTIHRWIVYAFCNYFGCTPDCGHRDGRGGFVFCRRCRRIINGIRKD